MQNSSQNLNYRTLLAQRQGKGFSEFEVKEILRQVLLQLSKIHLQQQAHGAIFLENLVQDENDNQVMLMGAIPPEQQQPNQASTVKDIYALGIAIITLLTAQPLTSLRDSEGNCKWEDYCTISDQFAGVLNRMIAPQSSYSFTSASEVLSALNFSPVQPFNPPHAAPPTPIYSPAPPVYPAYFQEPQQTQPETPQRSFTSIIASENQSGFPLWQVIGIGVIVILGLAVGMRLPVFLSSRGNRVESVGKNAIDSMIQLQQQFRGNHPEFAGTLTELKSIIQPAESAPFLEESADYQYTIVSADDSHAYMTAAARNEKLKSYSSVILLLGNGKATSLVCETERSSIYSPNMDQVISGNLQCPPDSRSIDSPVISANFIPYTIPDEPVASVPQNLTRSSNNRGNNPFENMRFPQSACGDDLPRDPNAYPLNFYPVFVAYSERNLETVKSRFCQDAFSMVRQEKGIRAIQVGSFTSLERAEFFKDFLNNNVGGAEVGKPTRIEGR